MAASKPVRVGNEIFPTKKALTEKIRSVLYATPIGESVAPEHWEFICNLFWLHPDADQKALGEDFPEFVVERNEFYGNQGFYVVRNDGTKDDFSIKVCMDGRPSARSEFLAACRDAVVPDIRIARDRLIKVHGAVCAVSGELLTRETMHVDHAPPWQFEHIVKAYLEESGITDWREQKAHIDEEAACVILESYLNNLKKEDK